jgi:hypothetical protein
VSRKHKPDGKHYANVGCRTYDDVTGGTRCTNNRTVSETKVVEGVVSELRAMLMHPELMKEFTATVEQWFKNKNKTDGTNLAQAEKRVRDCQRRVGNVTAALADTGFTGAVRAQLAKEEAALRDAEQALAASRHQARPNLFPHASLIRKEIDELLDALGGLRPSGVEICRHLSTISRRRVDALSTPRRPSSTLRLPLWSASRSRPGAAATRKRGSPREERPPRKGHGP